MEGKIKAGDELCNNDPRAGGAIVKVVAVAKDPKDGAWYAYYHAGTRKARIRFDRIYPTGTVRAQGYTLCAPYSQREII